MVESLYKIAITAGLFVLVSTILYSLPDADPLPRGIEDGINWFFSSLYSFDFIFPVNTFLQLVYYSFWFMALKYAVYAIRAIIRTVMPK